MAFLIRINCITEDKSSSKYVDYICFKNQNTNLPKGISEIKTNNDKTIVSLESKHVYEICLMSEKNDDQQIDYPMDNSQFTLDKKFFDMIKITPSYNSLKIRHKLVSVLSIAIWHCTRKEANILAKYGRLGAGTIISDQCQSSRPTALKA